VSCQILADTKKAYWIMEWTARPRVNEVTYIVTKVNIIRIARSLGTTCALRISDIESAKQTLRSLANS
jgi:hypothetical protein